jgi:hypothetical protein
VIIFIEFFYSFPMKYERILIFLKILHYVYFKNNNKLKIKVQMLCLYYFYFIYYIVDMLKVHIKSAEDLFLLFFKNSLELIKSIISF